MSSIFFCCFLKHTLAKQKKMTSKKMSIFPPAYKHETKKVHIPWEKKSHIFEKSPLPAILCDFTLLTIIEHAFSIFYQKNIDKFTILHRNFVFFFQNLPYQPYFAISPYFFIGVSPLIINFSPSYGKTFLTLWPSFQK